MTLQEIKDIIDVGDASLIYRGNAIFIDPRTNLETGKMQFLLGYKEFDGYFDSEDELFSAQVIDGKSLREICGELEAE
nr:MAG TPA: hypothetical protein [Caudoviricetes sp.]